MSGSGTGIVRPYNTHRGTTWDGVADSATSGAWVGAVDGPVGTMSFWFRVDGGDGVANRIILNSVGNRLRVQLGNTNALAIFGQTAVPALAFSFASVANFPAGSGWHHVVCSWDTAAVIGNSNLWIDGVWDSVATVIAAGNVDYTTAATVIGWTAFNGGLSEWYIDTLNWTNLVVQANRWNWIHPNGQAPNIGADGSGPSGAQPMIYLAEVGGVWVNLGSAGAFVIAGAPTVSADSPKDRWMASLIHNRRRRIHSAA